MLRWLLRLLLVGLILAAIGFVVSRLMGQDEDFDDYDDLDAGFDFEETPVEIDVPADDTAGADQNAGGGGEGAGSENGSKLTDVTGIGPAYEARLQALGIESLDDLLNADPSSLADQLGVIGGQAAVEDWIAQARQLTSGGGQDGNSNG